jgi:hypothetical protein
MNNNQLIISLTTWKKRINDITLPKVLTRLFLQETSVKYKVVLVLSEEEFPNKEKELPYELLLFKNEVKNFEILWTYKNTKALKKLNPTMLKYPDLPIMTIDDDMLVDKNIIEIFYNEYKNNPTLLLSSDAGNAKWAIPNSIEAILSVIRLFPPNSLYPLDDELFLKYFNYNDDEWNSIRAVLQSTHFKRVYCDTGNIIFRKTR